MNQKYALHGLSLLTCLIWSTAFPVTRMIGDNLSSETVALTRCLSALLVLIAVWLCQKKRNLPSGRDIPFFLVTGACGFAVYLILFTLGMRTVTSAESSVIIALTPVIVAALSTIFLGEKIGPRGWAATAGAFTGVAVLMLWENGADIQPGMVFTLGASMLFAVYNLVCRKLSSKGYSSIDTVTFSMAAAVFLLLWQLPETFSELSSASLLPVILAVYLGVFPSAAAYALWAKALSIAEKTSEVTNYMFVTPLFATVLGTVMLNEFPDAGTYIGGIIIVSMVILFNLSQKK